MNRYLFHCVLHLGIISIIAIVIVGKWGLRTTGKTTKPQSKTETVEPIQVKAPPPPPKTSIFWSELFKQNRTPGPREITDFIRGKEDIVLTPLWQKLGVVNSYDPAAFEKCFGKCEVDETRVNGVEKQDDRTILRIKTDWDYRYLVFKETEKNYIFLGNIDALCERYGPPDQEIATIGEKGTWLTISVLGATGTGISIHFQQWYDISREGVPLVLSYPLGGGQYERGRKASRDFDSRILSQSTVEDRYVVEVLFTVSYMNYLSEKDQVTLLLFSTKKKVRFVCNQYSHKFNIDPYHSQLSEKDLDRVYTIDDYPESLTNEQFLSYNYHELADLAVSGKHSQKIWLSEFLRICKNTRENKSLSAMLVRTTKNGQ